MKTTKRITALILSSLLLLTACKKEDIQTEEQAEPQEFKVSMTDAPGDYEALTVEVESVEAYNESSGWITLNNETQFVSVLDLTNGAEMELAAMQNIEAGFYSKIRLNFGDNHSLRLKSTNEVEIGEIVITADLLVELDWEGPKQIELEIDEEISASQGVDLLIDFNVAQSIIKDGKDYLIKPVITEIKDRATGIDGKVKGTAGAALILTDGNDTLSTYTNAEGEFLIRGMKPGTYDLIAYPESMTGEILMQEERIEGVVITEGKIKNAGTIRF